MAVSKKGLRKVNVNNRPFLWQVNDMKTPLPQQGFVEAAGSERFIHIISANKKFIVHYRLPQEGDPTALLKIEGAEFPRRPGAKTIEVPRWRHDSKEYPTADFVRRLIAWCLEPETGS